MATIASDNNLFQGIPNNYKWYSITVWPTIHITDQNIDYIMQWTKAEVIDFDADNELIMKLAQQTTKLSQFAQLWKLGFQLNHGSYLSLRIHNFLEHLPALDTVQIAKSKMKDDHVEKFLRNQGKLTGWKVKKEFSFLVLTRIIDQTEWQRNRRCPH